jgi:hypothetical protein
MMAILHSTWKYSAEGFKIRKGPIGDGTYAQYRLKDGGLAILGPACLVDTYI